MGEEVAERAVAVAVAAPSVAAAVVAVLAGLFLQPTWCGVVVDKAVTVTGQPSSRSKNHEDREENEDDKEDPTNIVE